MPTVDKVLDEGWKLHQQGRIDDAKKIYQLVLDKVPNSPEAMVYMGIAHFDQRAYQQSATIYKKALKLRDNFPIAWNNLGNALRMLGEVNEAEECFSKSISQDPKYVSAHINRGTLWVWNGDVERGLQSYQRGLELQPDHAELHRNIGVIQLLLGNYDIGWPEYRWRWSMPGTYRPKSPAPIWSGEPLDGKSVLLYPEQGRGDAIQFIRVAKTLARCGATVFVECSHTMMPLFVSAEGIASLFPQRAALPLVDYQASFIDVVDVWHTVHEVLPFEVDVSNPSYLSVSDTLVDSWKAWLDENCRSDPHALRVGINWQGNRQHHADFYRSLHVSNLEPLSSMPNIKLVNLQFGDGAEQLDEVSFGDQILRLPDGIDNENGAFIDTSAIVKSLDAVVTSDTALAHLSGALGVTTHVLLGKTPDWRWLQEGDRTGWYPTMQLHRQVRIGDWSPAVQSVIHQLSAS